MASRVLRGVRSVEFYVCVSSKACFPFFLSSFLPTCLFNLAKAFSVIKATLGKPTTYVYICTKHSL